MGYIKANIIWDKWYRLLRLAARGNSQKHVT